MRETSAGCARHSERPSPACPRSTSLDREASIMRRAAVCRNWRAKAHAEKSNRTSYLRWRSRIPENRLLRPWDAAVRNRTILEPLVDNALGRVPGPHVGLEVSRLDRRIVRRQFVRVILFDFVDDDAEGIVVAIKAPCDRDLAALAEIPQVIAMLQQHLSRRHP